MFNEKSLDISSAKCSALRVSVTGNYKRILPHHLWHTKDPSLPNCWIAMSVEYNQVKIHSLVMVTFPYECKIPECKVKILNK